MNTYLSIFKHYLLSLLIAPIALFIYFTQVQVEGYRDIEQKIEEFMLLPKGEYLKPVVLGYEQLVGDIIWLRSIQVLGDKVVTPRGYDWAYHALDVVTTLDPKFAYAYQLGGVNLSVLGKRPDLSNMLLEKGMRENPDVWQIPFYLGFNNFFYLNDFKSAAEYMAIASKLPGHPAYLPKLAARLYVQAGEPAVALDILLRLYMETRDEKVRATVEQRIKEVTVERDIKILENAIESFRGGYRRDPEDLRELVERDIIKDLPLEPFGGFYYFNKDDGKIYSSIIKERMRVYGKGGG